MGQIKKIEALKNECSECKGTKRIKDPDSSNYWTCPYCQGTGKATIEIDKELFECPECSQAPDSFTAYNCKTCENQGEIPEGYEPFKWIKELSIEDYKFFFKFGNLHWADFIERLVNSKRVKQKRM